MAVQALSCGFCGTEVNAGFNTCKSCGATYKQKMGPLGALISFPMVIIIFCGLVAAGLGFIYGHVGIGLIGLISAGLAVYVIKLCAKAAPYKWWRTEA